MVPTTYIIASVRFLNLTLISADSCRVSMTSPHFKVCLALLLMASRIPLNINLDPVAAAHTVSFPDAGCQYMPVQCSIPFFLISVLECRYFVLYSLYRQITMYRDPGSWSLAGPTHDYCGLWFAHDHLRTGRHTRGCETSARLVGNYLVGNYGLIRGLPHSMNLKGTTYHVRGYA